VRIVVAEELPKAALADLGERHELRFATGLPRAGLLEAVTDADALIVRSATAVDPELMEAAPKLRVVGRAGVGVDNIDLEEATRRGILVCNVPEANVVSAAEHTMALLLALVRRIPRADASLRTGRWERSRLAGTELHGKSLGLVGFGRVGRLVAERARAFGMEILAHDPYVGDDAFRRAGVERSSTLERLLERADVVSLHLPLDDETENWLRRL